MPTLAEILSAATFAASPGQSRTGARIGAGVNPRTGTATGRGISRRGDGRRADPAQQNFDDALADAQAAAAQREEQLGAEIAGTEERLMAALAPLLDPQRVSAGEMAVGRAAEGAREAIRGRAGSARGLGANVARVQAGRQMAALGGQEAIQRQQAAQQAQEAAIGMQQRGMLQLLQQRLAAAGLSQQGQMAVLQALLQQQAIPQDPSAGERLLGLGAVVAPPVISGLFNRGGE